MKIFTSYYDPLDEDMQVQMNEDIARYSAERYHLDKIEFVYHPAWDSLVVAIIMILYE